MLYKSKLRGSFGRVYPIALVTVYILSLVEAFIRWQLERSGVQIRVVPSISFSLMGLFFMGSGIVQYYRYGMWIYLVLGFFVGLGCILAIYFFDPVNDLLRIWYVLNLLVIILIVLIFWGPLSSQERYEANARRLFRLASERIEDVADGFTDRPFSAGRVEVDKEDLLGFSRFLNGKYVVRSFHREESLYLAFSMNRSVLVIRDPEEVSYMSVSRAGEISVHVSQADYRQYRDNISFDQLCSSMAGVFLRFMDYYRQGLEQRIITELKTAR